MTTSYIVTVSITYRSKGATHEGTKVTRISSCLPGPFSIGLDRVEDAFYLYYNGGKQSLETSWTNYDLLASSILSQEYCGGDPPPKEQKYDCINAACTKKETYNTPGFYKSLSECETACGTKCSGQCIPNDEWSKIQSLANQLKNKNCS